MKQLTSTMSEVADSQLGHELDVEGLLQHKHQHAEAVKADDIAVTVDGDSDGDAQDTVAVPMYTFCTPSEQWSAKLLEDIPIPRCIARSAASALTDIRADAEDSGVGVIDESTSSWSFEIQFYLGPAGTGAPSHFHGHAINTLAYGEKVLIACSCSFYLCISFLGFSFYCVFYCYRVSTFRSAGCCILHLKPSTALLQRWSYFAVSTTALTVT